MLIVERDNAKHVAITSNNIAKEKTIKLLYQMIECDISYGVLSNNNEFNSRTIKSLKNKYSAELTKENTFFSKCL